MARLCERPGCSQPARVVYGVDGEHLLVWMTELDDVAADRRNVLCRRHADAMVVPLGWMLDDRRPPPQLFVTPPLDANASHRRQRDRSADRPSVDGQQLAWTDEMLRPVLSDADASDAPDVAADPVVAPDPGVHPGASAALDPVEIAESVAAESVVVESAAAESAVAESAVAESAVAGLPVDRVEPVAPWRPKFDQADDLGGLLHTRSPLLARAFHGSARPDTRGRERPVDDGDTDGDADGDAVELH